MKNIVASFQRGTDLAFLIFTTFFWGSTFVFVKSTVQLIPLDGFLVVRFGLATIIVVLFIFVDPAIYKALLKLQTWKFGAVLGTLLYASFWFQTVGLKYTTPSKAAFITGLNVILVPIVQRLPPFREKVKTSAYAIATLALLGLALMTVDFTQFHLLWADAIIFLTALAVAYHIVVVSRAKNTNIHALLIAQLFIVFVESLVIAVLRKNTWNPFTPAPEIVWITLIFTAVLATGFAFWAQINAQQHKVKASSIALIFSLEPVFALLIDIIIKVYPTIIVLLGMALILIATLLAIFNETDLGIEVVP